jgi:hypothetical protein
VASQSLPAISGKPVAVFVGRRFADALDVRVHRETQRIGVDAVVGRVADRRLEDDVGMRLEPLDHQAVGEMAIVIQGVQQMMVPEGRPAFVHHLGLPLRVEVLRHLAHDANDFALPGFEQRRVLLDEVEQVFLRFGGKALRFLSRRPPFPVGGSVRQISFTCCCA